MRVKEAAGVRAAAGQAGACAGGSGGALAPPKDPGPKKAPEKVFTPLAQPLKEILKAPGPLVKDGTVVPTWNWRSQGTTNFSGNHKKAGFHRQMICTLDGRLLVITDPLPGARYDAHAFRAHGLDRLLDSSTLADEGCVGLGLATSRKHSLVSG